MSEKVPSCMKSPAACTRSPDINKIVPGYQGYPYPYPRYFNKAVPGSRVFCRGRTRLTKVSGTGVDVLPKLPKCRVRVWMYRTYQRVGHRYGCFTKLTKESGMVVLLLPVSVPNLGYFNRAEPDTRVFCRGSTELIKVSGTGMDVVTNLPKCRVRVWKSHQATKVLGTGNRRGMYPLYTLVRTLPTTNSEYSCT